MYNTYIHNYEVACSLVGLLVVLIPRGSDVRGSGMARRSRLKKKKLNCQRKWCSTSRYSVCTVPTYLTLAVKCMKCASHGQ